MKHFIGTYLDSTTYRSFSIAAAESGLSKSALLKKLVAAKLAAKPSAKRKPRAIQPTPCGR